MTALLPAINLTFFTSDNSDDPKNKKKGLAPDHALQGIKFLKGIFHGVGNRCGHDPKSPRFRILENPHKTEVEKDDYGHTRKPHFFYKITERLQDLYFYPKMFKAFTHHHDEYGNPTRLIRSELRESEQVLMDALGHHVNLASANPDEDSDYVRVGVPTKEGFLYLNNRYWQQVTGLSRERLSNAFTSLENKGVILRERRYEERDDGKFRSMSTATMIAKDFFDELGLLDELLDLQEQAYKKLKENAERLQKTARQMLTCAKSKPKPEDKKKNREYADSFPPSDRRHWEFKLHHKQRRAFHQKVNEVAIESVEKGISLSAEEAYKKAYTTIVRY